MTSRTYAEVLHALVPRNSRDALAADLMRLRALVPELPLDPLLDHDVVPAIVGHTVCNELARDQHPLAQALLTALRSSQRLHLLPEICAEFAAIQARHVAVSEPKVAAVDMN